MSDTSEQILGINNILNKLLDKKLAFFVGAGIDYHSGVPLVRGEYGIMNTILNQLPLNKEDKELILSNYTLPFESFFGTLSKHSDIDELLNIFHIADINTNHLFLARLVKLGLLKTIVTTNFTQLIEKAFIQEGLIENIDYSVIYSDENMLNVDFEDGKVKLIKIHGTVSDKKSLIITIEQIANKDSLSPRKNIIEYLFKKGSHESIVILGYSCSDVFDITPLVKDTESNKEVLFINHSFESDEHYATSQSINSVESGGIFSNLKSGTWFNYNTDKLVEKLWKNLYVENNNLKQYSFKSINIQEYRLKQKDILNSARKWKLQIEEKEKDEKLYYISGELLYNITCKTNSLKYYEDILQILIEQNRELEVSQTLGHLTLLYNSLNDDKAYKYALDGLEIAKKIGNSSLQQIHHKNLAVYYRRKSQIEDAIEHFKNAIKISVENSKIIGKIYIEFGILYKQIKNYELARDYFEKAIKEFVDNGSLTDQGWCFGNIGNIYYHHLKDYAKAEEHYTKAIYIANNMSHKFNQQVWYGNLGNLYVDIKKYKEGYDYLIKALDLSKQINDKKGTGIWLSNLSDYYYKIGNITSAIENMKESIYLAKILDDKISVSTRTEILKEYKIHDKNKAK